MTRRFLHSLLHISHQDKDLLCTNALLLPCAMDAKTILTKPRSLHWPDFLLRVKERRTIFSSLTLFGCNEDRRAVVIQFSPAKTVLVNLTRRTRIKIMRQRESQDVLFISYAPEVFVWQRAFAFEMVVGIASLLATSKLNNYGHDWFFSFVTREK